MVKVNRGKTIDEIDARIYETFTKPFRYLCNCVSRYPNPFEGKGNKIFCLLLLSGETQASEFFLNIE